MKKILVSRNNPKNRCYTIDGEVLIIAQKEHKMKGKLPSEQHFFVGVESRMPAAYGWVKSLDEDIDEVGLAKKYSTNPSKELVESCRVILEAAQKYDDETPMACSCVAVGVLEKKKVIKVHKVLFYK